MSILTFQNITYILVLIIGITMSWKRGEKEGSTYMLKYLRDHKFLDDTGYNKFMAHIRAEKRATNMFNKKDNDKDEKDI
tara:strand:+ start:112 stop:348 length:237 start_codon:yes stop_codon:yes gene_type:complete